MLKLSKLAGLFAAMMLAIMWVAPAQAQATRTWVSGVGDDANPCSRTAPCKTFAGAISKTATGGEIDCLDPGGFGGITITKSITLDCGGGIGGQIGSILVFSTNGITVNGAGALVKIRNLTINGIAGAGAPGLTGIRFTQGAALIVEHVGIFGFGGTAGTNAGISFEPGVVTASNAASLYMLDVEIQYGLADCVLIHPASGGSAKAELSRVTCLNNAGSGLRVDSTGLTGGTGSVVVATESTFSGSQYGVLALTPAGTAPVSMSLTKITSSNNTIGGVIANGAATYVTLGGSTIAGNSTGIGAINGGALKSFGDNWFSVNGTDGTPTAPNLSKM